MLELTIPFDKLYDEIELLTEAGFDLDREYDEFQSKNIEAMVYQQEDNPLILITLLYKRINNLEEIVNRIQFGNNFDD